MCFLLFNVAPNNSADIPKGIIYSHIGHLILIANSGDNISSTEFYFNSNASRGLDPGFDASMFGGVAPAYALYSHLVENNTDTPYAIQALGGEDLNNITIPLGLNASQGQTIVLSVLQSDLPSHINVYLDDTLNNTSTLLNTSDYTFTAETNLLGVGRFFLKFESNALNSNESALDSLKVFTKTNNTIIIEGSFNYNTSFKLYDLSGKLIKIKSINHTNSNTIIDTSGLSAGVYIIKLKDGFKKRTEKIVVN